MSPSATRLSEVRSACRWVTERAEGVRIRHQRLGSYAEELGGIASFPLFLDPRYHHLGHGDETVAFVLCLDAVNFGSGWFPWLVRRRGLGGYFTIAVSLAERFAERPLSARDLVEMDGAECAEIFGQRDAPLPVEELMGHFARAWRHLGGHLLERYRGAYGGLVEEARGSAERLVELLVEVPGFGDVAVYRERRVPFYKRAQLAVVDLALALDGKGLGSFFDLDALTLFADNQVPHVLRVDGLLAFDAALVARIEAGEEIPAGSPAEVEIRASAVHAVELLSARMAAIGRRRSPWELDQLLWNRGLEPAYGAPPHRTRSLYY